MAKKSLKRGLFITFEGVEGCGKSTHSRLIYKYLKRLGFSCLYTKEPGGTKIGDAIRKILLDPKNTSLDDITELFLFEANRSQVVNEVIRPALNQKKIVISDRFFDATMAYQGDGNRLSKGIIKKMNNLATGGIRPDLTIILDIDVKMGLRRAAQRHRRDRMERKPLSFHSRVRRGYIDVAKKEPGRIKLITTRKDINHTQRLIKQKILDVIQRYKVTR